MQHMRWLWSMLLLSCCINDAPHDDAPYSIRDFNIYPFTMLAARPATDGGYVVVTDDGGVVKLTGEGSVAWEYRDAPGVVSQAFETRDGGIVAISTQRKNKLDTLANEVAEDQDTLDITLVLCKLDRMGTLQWKRSWHMAYLTAQSANDLYFRQIINFNLHFNNYGLGAEAANGDLFIVFSYDGAPQRPTFYKLIRFSHDGILQAMQNFPMKFSFSRVYALDIADDRLILSKGGPTWCEFDYYNQNLQMIQSHRYDTLAVPTFSTILRLNNGDIAFAGHVDKQDNDVIYSNYDYAMILTDDLARIRFLTYGDANSRDLCFSATVDPSGNIVIMRTQREGDQLFQNNRSDVTVAIYDVNGVLLDEQRVSKDHGLEGYFIQATADDTFVILGKKVGFSQTQTSSHTFFMKVRRNN